LLIETCPMILRLALSAPLLVLAACGSAPDAPNPDRILVVPATSIQATTIGRAAPVAAAAPIRHAPTLTVEESARINTSEMWSEPIAADAEEMVIE
jgi:hypothetical protein